jgi:hypothetical protein
MEVLMKHSRISGVEAFLLAACETGGDLWRQIHQSGELDRPGHFSDPGSVRRCTEMPDRTAERSS